MFFRMGAVGWIIVLVLIVIILSTIDNMFFHGGTAQSVQSPQAIPALPSAPQTPFGGSAPLGSGPQSNVPPAAAKSAADAAAARAELAEASKLLTEAAASVDQALAQLTTWYTEVEPLRDNADGRAIADHADLARQMAYLLQQPRPPKSDVLQDGDRVKTLRSEVERLAALDPPEPLAPGKKSEVEQLHERSDEAQTVWTDAVERARAITREARRQQAVSPASSLPASPPATPMVATVASTTTQATPPEATPSAASSSVPPPTAVTPATTPQPTTGPAPTPLAAEPSAGTPPAAGALSQDALPTAASPVQGKTLQEKVIEIDDQNKLADLQRKIAKDAERKLIKDREIEARRQLEERLAAEKAKLVEEARSADVQRVLQPFFVRRSVQPRLAGSSLQMRHTLDDQPMSLSALEGVGALAETLNGLSVLARVGSHRELSSPRWDFSSSSRTWSPDTQDRLKQAQDLLRRLGPTLVEEKLLSP